MRKAILGHQDLRTGNADATLKGRREGDQPMLRFDLNLLNALDALISERNVTRAAERLHVTQPTMSGMLQRLRYQFDDQILTRNGRNMELTYFGQSLIEPVREALKGVELLVRAEPTFDPKTSTRTFTAMASDYCTLIFMPRVIARLAQIAPGVRLEIQSLNSPVERMLSGEIDLCISTDDRSLLSSQRGQEELLESEFLFSDEFVCVVAKDHPLKSPATMAEYLLYPHVGVQMAGDLDTIETASLRVHATAYKPGYMVADFSLVPAIVAVSNLVGVVQKRLAQIAAKTHAIRIVAAPLEIPKINETLWWHPRHALEPSHVWLRQVLCDEAVAWLAETQSPRNSLSTIQGLGCRNLG
jgi:LysR family nod box-dependent transcriptional activator